MHRNDEKLNRMNTDLLKTGGNISDRGYDWLISKGVAPGHISDMWAEYNLLQSAPGQINDGFFQWLGDLLHVGSLSNRWKSFWSS